MSSTQERRNKYDYRTEYFKHNKGLFGCIYFCSQCGRPLLKKDVEVDHIVPLAKMGINHKVNCVACCRHCNRSKSDKLDKRAIRGIIFKLIEEVLIFVGNAVSLVARELFNLLCEFLNKNLYKSKGTLLFILVVVMMLFYIL
ncbi:HNH endonuclease [Paraclostridium bifermentans]|uniref:HNH endonuclease n=1 Tax=Paraclostridium bifermentans TaxID=1490 RepID=UPI00374E3BB5